MLDPDEPQAADVANPHGSAPFLLIGDHAGRRVPRALADLGLADAELARHIGWDIGIRELGEALSARLDAAFVAQTYSRLVIDCNRAADAPDAMPAVSDGTSVPGNAALSASDRQRRVAAIHAPYHAAISAALAGGRALVALHSFTPVMRDAVRPWHCGILHNGANDGFARAMLAALRAEPGLVIGDNEPYAMDSIDYTIPRHAFARGLPYVEIEVRQDLLGDAAGVAVWADRLARLLPVALG